MNKLLLELDNLFKNGKWNLLIKKTKLAISSEQPIPPYYNLLGLSLSKIGKDLEAKKIFVEAIEKFPDEISLKSNIALVLTNLKEYEIAEKYLIDGEKLNNDDIYLLYAKGNLKKEQKKFKEAEIIFKRICEKDIKFPKGLLLLGQNYIDLAHLTNEDSYYTLAKKNLLLCSEFFPKSVNVDYTLSTIIDYSKNDFHQKKMLNKIKNIELDDDQKSFIYFALGKSFEDQKKYDQSSEYIKIANFSKNKSTDKNILRNEILKYRNIKKIFDNINNTIQNKDRLFQNKIIFVVGLPRSGTSLVHQLLSTSTNTFGFGESDFLRRFFDKNIFDKNFISKILNKKTFEEYLINISNHIGKKYAMITDKKVFIDKMPPNFFWIGFIKLLFPNSKIVHTNRNIKDNCLSIYKNLFGLGDMDWSYNEKNILRFVLNYKDTMKYWKSKYSAFIYDVNYENLVNNKEETTKKLFEFCELNFDERVFDFYKSARTIRTVSINQVKKPIYQTSVNISSKYIEYFDFLNQLDQ